MTWSENPPVVVVLAKQFNPSVFSQVWLTKNGILDAEGAVRPNSVFTEHLVQAVTDDFVFAVMAGQMQLIPNIEPSLQQRLITDKLGTIIERLPHVPYYAVGLNFNWILDPDGKNVPTLSRALFASRNDGIYSRFSEPNARFGAYLSKDFGLFRMKLDIKPHNVELPSGEPSERIVFSFNFHADIPKDTDSVEALRKMLSLWDAAREEVALTIEAVEPEA